MGFETKLSLSPLGPMVLLDLLIPQVLSVTRCAASACRVLYHILLSYETGNRSFILHPAQWMT